VLTADSLARFAAVLADRSRAGICLALLDRRAWTAGELARHVGVARSTASEHLNVLVSAGLLAEERQGRHRYLRLADPQTAQLVEDFAATVGLLDRPSSLRAVRAARAARRRPRRRPACRGPDLLRPPRRRPRREPVRRAGRRGTHQHPQRPGLTSSGRVWFADLAGAGALRPCGTRPLVRTCLDWTERRSHLSGSLGAALCHQLLERAWITRTAQHRGVTVTPTGAQALANRLNLDLQALREQPSAVASGTDHVP